MDKIQRLFLDALSCALKKEYLTSVPALSPEEWDALYCLSQEQKVFPLIFEALCRLPEVREQPLFLPLKRHAVGQVMLQTRKTAEFLRVLEALTAAGITPLVVKGIICRNLYPLPDHRPSSDEDVLIPPEQSELCHRILTELELKTTVEGTRFETDYEIPYRQESGPLYIELHRHLFPPESEAYGNLNRFFAQAQARSVTESVDGIAVPTLGYTDHLFYLICHAFKHFLHSGFGIRQVCDIVLYANTYGAQVDWNGLFANCRSIRADLFAAAVFRIGQKYLTFDPEQACYPGFWQALPVDETAMLEDLLDAGVYGGTTMSRKHSSNITLDAAAAVQKGTRQGNSLILSLFPSAKKLEGRYPYLKDKPWLLPAAWANRMGTYLLESGSRKDSRAVDALEIGQKRVELLRQYGIIE